MDFLLLHARLSRSESPLPWETALLRRLPYARRLELERRAAQDRHASLVGMALVLLGCERVVAPGVSTRQFVLAPGARPSLHNGPDFSVSHSATHVACIVDRDGPVGIDIEPLDRVGGQFDAGRLRRWTATEAALKAAGLGVREHERVSLDQDLRCARIGDLDYALQEVSAIAGHTCHVASLARRVVSTAARVDVEGPDLSAAVERSFRLPAQRD